MFATTEDLSLPIRPTQQRRSYSDSFQHKGGASKHPANRKVKTSQPSPCFDSDDEIQVIQEQQTAIPIRGGLDRKHSDRHLDLDIGSIHAHKRRSSPLFERRKRDAFDLLGDFSESSDDEDDRRPTRGQYGRGRERHPKPLVHPQGTCLPQPPHRYDNNASRRDDYSPQLGHHSSRDSSLHGRHSHIELDNDMKDCSGSYFAKKLDSRRTSQLPLSSTISGLEHEAMVFDNFEDVSSVSSASKHEQDNKDPFDAHLHFVRPVMPICANPGAFVALDPIVTPSLSPNESLNDARHAEEMEARHRRHRLGHHRAASELFSSPTTSTTPIDVRATRRRATVGSEAAYRLPTFLSST